MIIIAFDHNVADKEGCTVLYDAFDKTVKG